MATEIFIEPELQELENGESAEQWYSLCVDLGLENQAKLANKSQELKAPPYMYIDPKTERIITTLCPRGVNYKKYNESTIPLDILQEIAKCEKNGWYKEIHIYYDNKSPDPFVIGIMSTGEHSWNVAKHLIGRWGAELIPFEMLESRAIARLKDDAEIALMELKTQIDFASKNVEMFLRQALAGKDNPSLNFRVSGTSSSLPF
jgi:hypothetical protein